MVRPEDIPALLMQIKQLVDLGATFGYPYQVKASHGLGSFKIFIYENEYRYGGDVWQTKHTPNFADIEADLRVVFDPFKNAGYAYFLMEQAGFDMCVREGRYNDSLSWYKKHFTRFLERYEQGIPFPYWHQVDDRYNVLIKHKLTNGSPEETQNS